MKAIVALLLATLLSLSSNSHATDRYFELRASANVYLDADRASDIVVRLKYKGGHEPQLLKRMADESQNGYYLVEVGSAKPKQGWIYKSFVRGYDNAGRQLPVSTVSTKRTTNAYGACKEVFVNGKPPVAPDDVTPLCEEEDGVVFFASGYSKRDNHGYWSAYRLDEEKIAEMNETKRDRPSMQFRRNPKLGDGEYVQPRHDSYTGTGWDRGHLAPNGAMAWDEEAQKRSFTISNIAPQKPAMNRNIWRCFEYSIREWAADSGDTYVVVGTSRGAEVISSERDRNGVEINVPAHYLAMVYRTKPTPMAMGVMVPNSEGNLDIRTFMMPVSTLEQKSGYRFGLPDSIAQQAPDPKKWPTRIVKKELLGKLPNIDKQCPRAPLG